MEAVHLDTHVAVWLFEGGDAAQRVSARGLEAIDAASSRFVSPAVLVELALLRQTGRVAKEPQDILLKLHESIGVELAREEFGEVAAEAATMAWTRDPFDRLIAAQALVAGAALVTKDRKIRAHLECAVW